MWFGQLRVLGQLWGCCGLLGMAELGKDPGTQPRAMLGPHCVPGAGDEPQPEGPVSLQSCSSPGRLRGAPQLQVGTWGAKEGAQLPGHTSAKAAQSPPASCMGPAQLVLGSPGWGELVLPPQSWIGCMGRVSQHRPSPHLKPSQHRLGYSACTHGGPQPRSHHSPAALCCGMRGLQGASAGEQGRPVGCSCWQRCRGGARGAGNSCLQGATAFGCLGEPHTANAALGLGQSWGDLWGAPCLWGERYPQPGCRAGAGEPRGWMEGR